MELDRNTDVRISEANKSLINATWLALQQQNRTHQGQKVQLRKNTPLPVDAWQYGIYIFYAGATVTELKAVWEGTTWTGNANYNWRKGKDKELQKELENGREAQTHVDIIDQIQARPPALMEKNDKRLQFVPQIGWQELKDVILAKLNNITSVSKKG